MNMLPVWTAIQRKRKKTPFPFLLAHSFPLQSYPLNPCLLISPILSEQNPWKKDFSMAFKPISRKAMATGAGMLDLRFPYPPYSHLLLLVSGLTLVCHRVDVIMRCSVCPQNEDSAWQYQSLLCMKTCAYVGSHEYLAAGICLWWVSMSWCLPDYEVHSEMTPHQSKQINNYVNSRLCRVLVLAVWGMISFTHVGLCEPRVCFGGIEHAVGKHQKWKEEWKTVKRNSSQKSLVSGTLIPLRCDQI